MVGVGVGVENPVHRPPFALDIAEDRVGTGRGGRTGYLDEDMNGIDNGAASGGGIGHDILDAAAAAIVKTLDHRLVSRLTREPAHGAREVAAAILADCFDILAPH